MVANVWYKKFVLSHHRVTFNFFPNVFKTYFPSRQTTGPPNGADCGGAKLCRGGGAKLCLVLGFRHVLKVEIGWSEVGKVEILRVEYFLWMDLFRCFENLSENIWRDFLLAVSYLRILFLKKTLKEITDFKWIWKIMCFILAFSIPQFLKAKNANM